MRRLKPVDLSLLLYPSFTLPLFKLENRRLVKLYGYAANTVLEIAGDHVECSGPGCSQEVLGYWLGQWLHAIDALSKTAGESVEVLLKAYNSVGVMASPQDIEAIAVTVFLSRNTDYHTNTVRWARKLFAECLDDRGRLDAYCAKKTLPLLGNSYQLKQLTEVLEDLLATLKQKYSSIWDLRYELLKLKHVGPKTADAVILHAGLAGYATPSDIHYERIARRLALLPPHARKPQKQWCLQAEAYCPECKWKTMCITGASISAFKQYSGLIQTIAYIHDKLYCTKKKCQKCKLKNMCRENQALGWKHRQRNLAMSRVHLLEP